METIYLILIFMAFVQFILRRDGADVPLSDCILNLGTLNEWVH